MTGPDFWEKFMGNDRVAVCVSSKFLIQKIGCVMWEFATYLEDYVPG